MHPEVRMNYLASPPLVVAYAIAGRMDSDLYPEPLVEIHPHDASTLGIENGDAVRVTSRRASIVLRAQVTDKTNRGVVFIPFHFREAAANLLTHDQLDPQARIPEYKAAVVRVSKARPEELAGRPEPQPRGRR
ncbi:hypothetical protein D6792_01140 [Candidatus Parcubacteria bacterium]|nr:MAG: hypothetical protein D6792_01140 [Candidatus Parcubacteria bacterium]